MGVFELCGAVACLCVVGRVGVSFWLRSGPKNQNPNHQIKVPLPSSKHEFESARFEVCARISLKFMFQVVCGPVKSAMTVHEMMCWCQTSPEWFIQNKSTCSFFPLQCAAFCAARVLLPMHLRSFVSSVTPFMKPFPLFCFRLML